MTPHERAVRAVETPGWLVKEIAPVVGDGRGLRVTVNVETVTLRGAILTELIEREIAEAVAAEREACARLVEEQGDCRYVEHVQGFCECGPKAAAIRARGKM